MSPMHGEYLHSWSVSGKAPARAFRRISTSCYFFPSKWIASSVPVLLVMNTSRGRFGQLRVTSNKPKPLYQATLAFARCRWLADLACPHSRPIQSIASDSSRYEVGSRWRRSWSGACMRISTVCPIVTVLSRGRYCSATKIGDECLC